MPFKKVGKHFVSPTGRKFTKKQVAMYYANNGEFPKGQKKRRKKRKKKK